MTHACIHPHFDAAVGLLPQHDIPTFAYGVVKLTYEVRGGWTRPRDPEPLAEPPWQRPPTHAFTSPDDHALHKPGTDVIVLGDAWFPRPAPRGRVTVTVGDTAHAIDVFGPRRGSWSPKQGARFSEPELVERMAMVMGNAYGGGDPRVPVPEPESLGDLLRLAADHPGVYPRNPYGKGYVVVPEPLDDVPLPNLDDPADPLTPARWLVGDPAQWWRQPRPVFLGFRMANVFGRAVHLGVRPWFPPPDDERLPEVAAGELDPGFLATTGPAFEAMDPRFFHAAPAPLAHDRLRPGDVVCVDGMHPRQQRMAFAVPAPPRLGLALEGRALAAEPRLCSLVVRPAEQVVTTTWVLRADRMHRRFIPEIHAEIPLALHVDRVVVPYLPPPTLRARLHAGSRTHA
jgi:hypothetical protein